LFDILTAIVLTNNIRSHSRKSSC